MHPGMISWWRARRAREQTARFAGRVACGGHVDGLYGAGARHFGDVGGGSFGVRRPLRFIARRLNLDENQLAELARVIADLKTERAQAGVDDRRAIAAFAEAVAGSAFDEAKAEQGARLRVESAENLRTALVDALRKIHALLRDDQRAELAYLIRTGAIAL